MIPLSIAMLLRALGWKKTVDKAGGVPRKKRGKKSCKQALIAIRDAQTAILKCPTIPNVLVYGVWSKANLARPSLHKNSMEVVYGGLWRLWRLWRGIRGLGDLGGLV